MDPECNISGNSAIGNKTTTDYQTLLDADVLIDFTSIDATLEHIQWCKQHNKALVIGTTGLNSEIQKGLSMTKYFIFG